MDATKYWEGYTKQVDYNMVILPDGLMTCKDSLYYDPLCLTLCVCVWVCVWVCVCLSLCVCQVSCEVVPEIFLRACLCIINEIK